MSSPPPVPLPTTSGESAERNMAVSRRPVAGRTNGKKTASHSASNGKKATPRSVSNGKKNAAKRSAAPSVKSSARPAAKSSAKNVTTTARKPSNNQHDDEAITPIAVADALCRTANETCRQRDRRSRLSNIGAAKWELSAAEAVVDACDLSVEEGVREFEKQCRKDPISDSPEIRQAASSLWLAAREYIRRLSIANRASRQLSQSHDADDFSDIHLEYELEASSLLALKQAVGVYSKLRPEAR
jgi:hypothetical protein